MVSDGLPALLGNQSLFTFAVEGCDEELRVVRFNGHEAISQLFEFRLELASSTLPLEALVDRPATLTIEGIHGARHVNGFLSEAGYIGETSSYTLYRVTLVPALWRLQQRADCRIFQRQTTPEIVAKVLEAAGIPRADFRFDLRASFEPRDYCVQYRETDLDFVRRLLEDAGVVHYFEHEEGRHVLVMTDRPDALPIAGDPTLRFNYEGEREYVARFSLSEGVRPQRVTIRDRNLHRPEQPLEASEGAGSERELYDYPGGFQEPGRGAPHRGGQQARLRLEALQAARRRGEGESVCPRLVPGFAFTLADAVRGHLEGEYRVVRVTHRGEQPQALDEGAAGRFSYSNVFECTDAQAPYRAPRATPRPLVHGAQTATVVGPAGEEVYVDEHGRVKVQFHWDRKGSFDESSSCWVRVSQGWAGNGFGAVFLPRIGHEVIVDFLEGDPDRPLVTGRVYTGVNAPPYPLPDEKTKSTIKSESTPGGGGYNELRFEDAKGREEIFLHGQRDWNIVIERDKTQRVGHDEALDVGNDRTARIGRDERETIGHDRTIEVGSRHTEAIGASMTISIGADLSETVAAGASHTIGADLTETIGGAKVETVALASALTIGAAYQVSVGGAMNETVGLARSEQVGLAKSVAVGGDSSETIGGAKSLQAADNITASAGQNVALSAGKHVTLAAAQNILASAGKQASVVVADKITFQCGKATIVIKKDGELTIDARALSVRALGQVTIRGSRIKLN